MFSFNEAEISIFAFSCLIAPSLAAPLNLPSWLEPMLPVKGASLSEEIKCYSLPYGGIGFLSHILTYWALFWLGFGRKPYWPCSKLSAGLFDLFLAFIQTVISIAIAGYTIHRCQNRWQFVLIAVWKVVLSLEVGIFGFSAAIKARDRSKNNKSDRESYSYSPVSPAVSKTLQKMKTIWSIDDWTPWTLLFYAAGMVVGMVGLLSIVWNLRHNEQILDITAVFGAVTATIIVVCILLVFFHCCSCMSINIGKAILAMFFTTILVCALYSDWILGVIAGSLEGFPTSDNVFLYWVSFSSWVLFPSC